jgi:uncharacterized protein YkwD
MKKSTITLILTILTNFVFSQKYRDLIFVELPNNTVRIDRKEGNEVPLEEFAMYCSLEVSYTKNFDNDEFNRHFEKKLNEYRKSKGLNPVTVDLTLKDYCVDHSDWIARTGILSHNQTTKPYLGFADRARKFKIYDRLISECAGMTLPAPSIFWFMEYDPKVNRYDYLAEAVLFGFKNSKCHNAIMIDPRNTKFYCSLTFNEERSSKVLAFSQK